MLTPSPSVPLSTDESVAAIARMALVPKMLETVCRLTGMRFAAIARVTEERWTTCAVLDDLEFGLQPGADLVLDSTICHEIRSHRQPVIFAQASRHPVYSTHHTPKIYGFESYVSVPIVTETGEFFGTLCALDPEPKDLRESTVIDTLTLFASLVAAHLVMESRARGAEEALQAELDTGILREQFLAVVGHDLRSPLQGARLVAEQLGEMQQTERGHRLVHHLSQSVTRMSGLIDDVMDFARGRLGGGIQVHRIEHRDLGAVIRAAVDEVRAGQPHCEIVVRGAVTDPVRFDAKRLRQLLANLLNNAVSHGDPTEPVIVSAAMAGNDVVIEVANQGEPIPPEMMTKLFEPFVRPASFNPRPGLGLGLYIASEIAKGHGGSLSVSSSQSTGTVFTVRFPTGSH